MYGYIRYGSNCYLIEISVIPIHNKPFMPNTHYIYSNRSDYYSSVTVSYYLYPLCLISQHRRHPKSGISINRYQY